MIDIVTPVDGDHSLAWAIMSMNYAFDTPSEKIVRFQDEVTAQDSFPSSSPSDRRCSPGPPGGTAPALGPDGDRLPEVAKAARP